MSENAIINKYRPSDFDEVVGHEQQLRALQRAINGTAVPHSYLFSGPGGTGKTSLARIVGGILECDILEIDAASNSGVDAMRELSSFTNYTALTDSGRRMVLIDECHRLSANAWDVLLKPMEEPPAHLFFALCTTALAKVPETIRIRCFHTVLHPLKPDEMEALLSGVAEAEGWKIPDAVLAAVLENAEGSPRRGLSMLQQVEGAKSVEDVDKILRVMKEGNPLYDLCSAVMKKGCTWAIVQRHLSKLADEDYPGALEVMSAFLATGMARAKSDAEAKRYWAFLDALMFPAASYVPKAVLTAAIGRMLWGGGSNG